MNEVFVNAGIDLLGLSDKVYLVWGETMKSEFKEYLKNEFGIVQRVLKIADSALKEVASEFRH